MTSDINSFTGQYSWLSNFSPHEAEYEGVVYQTSEHAYQAAKFLDPEARKFIASCKTPGAAKRAGSGGNLRPHWDNIRIEVMSAVLKSKFENPDNKVGDQTLKQMLMGTLDARLVEGNNYKDTFWGVCEGVGTNHLGRLLMVLREEFQRVATVREEDKGVKEDAYLKRLEGIQVQEYAEMKHREALLAAWAVCSDTFGVGAYSEGVQDARRWVAKQLLERSGSNQLSDLDKMELAKLRALAAEVAPLRSSLEGRAKEVELLKAQLGAVSQPADPEHQIECATCDDKGWYSRD